MHFRVLIIFVFVVFGFMFRVSACQTCTIPNLGKDNKIGQEKNSQKRWFTEYLFEQKNWDKMDARDAHNLHHNGHHFHDKTSEDFHHLKIGVHPTEDWTVFAEVPYVIRRSLEVDDHSILGSEQTSEGLGDLNLIGTYRLIKTDGGDFSLAGGVKFTTGETKEENSIGTRFEPELQPGSGSYDYMLGGIYSHMIDSIGLIANTSYVFTTRGSQSFQFGDTLTTALFADYLLNPSNKSFQLKPGADFIFQYQDKQKSDGVKIKDSGGLTLLLGPALKVEVNKTIIAFSRFMVPAYQDLGGVHQELDFEWTTGGKIAW